MWNGLFIVSFQLNMWRKICCLIQFLFFCLLFCCLYCYSYWLNYSIGTSLSIQRLFCQLWWLPDKIAYPHLVLSCKVDIKIYLFSLSLYLGELQCVVHEIILKFLEFVVILYMMIKSMFYFSKSSFLKPSGIFLNFKSFLYRSSINNTFKCSVLRIILDVLFAYSVLFCWNLVINTWHSLILYL